MVHKTSVLLTTEGTYPCYSGGVSVWCDYLVRYLRNIDYHIFAITHAPSQQARFACPPNVTSCVLHPMWGTEEPGADEMNFSQIHERKIRTDRAVLLRRFLPHFKTALRHLFSCDPDPELLAKGLFGLHQYFGEYDYANSMGSRAAWEAFLEAAAASVLSLNLEEATHCMRWLQRYLSLLAARFPKVDLVHSSMAGLAGIPGVLCKLARGSGYLLTEHGIHMRELYLHLSRNSYSSRCRQFLVMFHRAITRMNYRHADVVTCLGEFNRQWQLRFGADSARIYVVPNGVDPATFHPRPSPPRSRPTVLTMARIFRLKGIDVLIRAAAEVRDRVPEVRFLVLGEIADQAYFRECLGLVEELHLQNHVSFGVTSDSANAYVEADIYCLPSRSEGLPYAVIEAMMCGCPVVAADVGNVADVLGGTGLTVTPNDSGEIAAALLQLLNAPGAEDLRRSLSRQALERARRHFTISQFTQRFEEIYDELALAPSDAVLSLATG
jgi:glycosyltransferase involved in cell wall biosynthesis